MKKSFILKIIIYFLIIIAAYTGYAFSSPCFYEITPHPYIVAKNVNSEGVLSQGDQIRELQRFNGKIYIGYGDSGSNTNPIQIISYNPELEDYEEEFLAETEAIVHYRVLNNILFALYDDIQGKEWDDNAGTSRPRYPGYAKLENGKMVYGKEPVKIQMVWA